MHTHPCFLTVTRIYAVPSSLHLPWHDLLLSTFSSASWILFLDEFNPGRVSVRKPFSQKSHCLPITFPKTINLIDINARELGRFHNLCYSDGFGGYLLFKSRFCYENGRKFVFFQNESAGIVLFGNGKLGLIRLYMGFNEARRCQISEWEIIHDGKGFRFDDIVEFKGRVLGIDRRGRVYEIWCHSSLINPVFPTIVGGGGRRKQLVESLGFLYLVIRCCTHQRKTKNRTREEADGLNDEKWETKFKVYMLDEGRGKWIEISSIGDRFFFFGMDFSFTSSARELGTHAENSIVFKRHSFHSYNSKDDGDLRIPEPERGDIDIVVCHLNDVVHFSANGSYAGYSDLLWPPPSWIWYFDRSMRSRILETAFGEMFDRIPMHEKPMQVTANEQTGEVDVMGFCCSLRGRIIIDLFRRVFKLKKELLSLEKDFMEYLKMSQEECTTEEMLIHSETGYHDALQIAAEHW